MRPLFEDPGGDRWETDGWFLGLIMVGIVALVTFFQFLPGGFDFTWVHVALVVPLAVMNAYTEETTLRLPYVTMGANETDSPAYGLVMGWVVFGGLHYWGAAPNGIIGAVMSALLEFVLSKSIQETKGVFWTFTIHFLQDFPILLFILNQAH